MRLIICAKITSASATKKAAARTPHALARFSSHFIMIQPLLLLIGFKQLSPGIACFFCPLLGHDLANLFELSTQTVWQLVDLHAIIGQGLSQLGGQLAAHFPTPLFSDLRSEERRVGKECRRRRCTAHLA